ncbi:MAG: hypothetical protein ACI89U_001787 [Gammaproteobacteria bacterium]|jgi:uncharacterized protein (DUF1330 family)
MSVYIIATIEIADREEYAIYESGFMEILNKFDGQILSVDEAPKVLEGNWSSSRTVLLSFSSSEKAMSWYRSEKYQELARHRFSASVANIALIQGLEPDR